jgi:uncharacterized RDD family membrane protein YckC
MHTHILQAKIHAALLAQARRDPISGDFLQEGDEVVFCAGCRSAFLKDSWEYLGKTHCGQWDTLQQAPTVYEDITLRKAKQGAVQDLPPEPPYIQDGLGNLLTKIFVLFIDGVARLLCIFFIASTVGLEHFTTQHYLIFFLALLLVWDALFFGQSPGKRVMGLVIVKTNQQEKAKYTHWLLRQMASATLFYGPWFFPGKMAVFLLSLGLVVNLVFLAQKKCSLVSWLTHTRVISGEELDWNAYRARHKDRLRL